jgi:hypothetical protein
MEETTVPPRAVGGALEGPAAEGTSVPSRLNIVAPPCEGTEEALARESVVGAFDGAFKGEEEGTTVPSRLNVVGGPLEGSGAWLLGVATRVPVGALDL